MRRVAGKKRLVHFQRLLDVFRLQPKIIRHVAHGHDIKHKRRPADGIKIHEKNIAALILQEVPSVKIAVANAARAILNLLPQPRPQCFVLGDAGIVLLTEEPKVAVYEELPAVRDRFRGILRHKLVKTPDQAADFSRASRELRLVPGDEFHENDQLLLPVIFGFGKCLSAFGQDDLRDGEVICREISHDGERLFCSIKKSGTDNLQQVLFLPVDNICMAAALSQKLQ